MPFPARASRPLGLASFLLAALAAAISAHAAPARHGASEVLLVVNADSPTSQAVGAHYQQARGITNVLDIQCPDSATDPNNEGIDYADFTTEIANPISTYLATHPGINFIVLTKGIPLGIYDAPYGSGETLGHGLPSVDSYLAALNYAKVLGARKAIINSKYAAGAIGYAWNNRYYKATVPFTHAKFGGYLVTRLDGYTQADAMALVDRALQAEQGLGNGPILLDVEPDYGVVGSGIQLVNPYSYCNADLCNIGSILQASGVPCDFETTETFAGNQSNLLGYFSFGSNDDHFDLSAYDSLSFAPGAIGDTFVSTSARTMIGSPGSWPSDQQSLIADLVAEGITGVEGYVNEPDIWVSSPSLDLTHYQQGYTLAESFYAGNQLIAWEGIILGDPLCAPYFSSPDTLVTPTRASAYSGIVRGVVKESCTEGLLDVANTVAGNHLTYLTAYPDTATSLIARVASTNSGPTTIAVHLDTPTGPLVGSLSVPPTGDGQAWTSVTCNLTPVTGRHHPCFVFSAPNVSLEWFAF